MNWTKIATALIYVMAPLAAFAINYHVLTVILVVVAILVLICRDAEYRAGAVNPNAYGDHPLGTLQSNVECLFLENCYITMVRSKKDGLLYAVMRPGRTNPVATGVSLAEAAANAIEVISKE